MTISINLKKLKDLKCTAGCYMIIYAISTNQFLKLFKLYDNEDDLAQAQELDVITFGSNFNSFTISPEQIEKAKSLLNNDISWYKEWYDLFPKGIKSGGYYVKSDFIAVCKKLSNFTSKYDISKDDILKATKTYISVMESKNYVGIQIARNFIEKDGASTLYSYIENLNDTTTILTNSNTSFSTDV